MTPGSGFGADSRRRRVVLPTFHLAEPADGLLDDLTDGTQFKVASKCNPGLALTLGYRDQAPGNATAPAGPSPTPRDRAG